MEELEITELKLSNVLIENFFRIDSEYYKKNDIKKIKLLKQNGSKKLYEISEITDGEHGSPDIDDNSNIIYLSGQNIKNNFIDFDNIRYCTKELHSKNQRSSLKRGNVLLSIVGTVGNSSVVYKEIIGNTDRNVSTIKKISEAISPYFLSTFLNSEFGKFQTKRASTGNVQPLLNLSQVKNIIVPLLSNIFQIKIEEMIKSAHSKQEQSKDLYNQAENILLEEVGLKDWKPTTENTKTTTLKNSFLESGRLDAEYYQPKYDEIESKIKTFSNYLPISDILNEDIKNGTTPNEVFKENGDINFVRVESFGSNLELIENNLQSIDNKTFEQYISNSIKYGDILVSMTGTIGNVAIYLSNKRALINQNLVKLTPNTQIVDIYYLALYIKSVGKLFLTKLQTGNVQPYVNIQNFKKLMIAIISEKQQQKISSVIQESFKLKKESERLLEIAKRAVEIAIEENEEIAIKFIEESQNDKSNL